MANTQELENAKNRVLAFVEKNFEGQEKEQLNKDLLEFLADEKGWEDNLSYLDNCVVGGFSPKYFVLFVKFNLAQLQLDRLAESGNIGKDELDAGFKYYEAMSKEMLVRVDELRGQIERTIAKLRYKAIWQIFAEIFRKGVLAKI